MGALEDDIQVSKQSGYVTCEKKRERAENFANKGDAESLDKAVVLLREIVNWALKNLPPDHGLTVFYQETLAYNLSELGSVVDDATKFEEAKNLHQNAANTRARIEGTSPPSEDFLDTQRNLADDFLGLKNYKRAAKLYKENYDYRKAHSDFGEDHEETLLTGYNLASCWHKLNDYVGAEDLNRKILASRKRLNAAESDIILSREGLGRNQTMLCKYKSAGILFEKNIKILKSRGNDLDTLKTNEEWLGKCIEGLKRQEEEERAIIDAENARKAAEIEKAEKTKKERAMVQRENARKAAEIYKANKERAWIAKENERKAAEAEKREKEAEEKARIERENQDKEQARIEKEKREEEEREWLRIKSIYQAKVQAEAREQARIKKERSEKEAKERLMLESENQAREQAIIEKARIRKEIREKEVKEKARIDSENQAKEQARIEKEMREEEEKERLRIESENQAREQVRIEKEKTEKEAKERSRIESEKQAREQARMNRENADRETREKENAAKAKADYEAQARKVLEKFDLMGKEAQAQRNGQSLAPNTPYCSTPDNRNLSSVSKVNNSSTRAQTPDPSKRRSWDGDRDDLKVPHRQRSNSHGTSGGSGKAFQNPTEFLAPQDRFAQHGKQGQALQKPAETVNPKPTEIKVPGSWHDDTSYSFEMATGTSLVNIVPDGKISLGNSNTMMEVPTIKEPASQSAPDIHRSLSDAGLRDKASGSSRQRAHSQGPAISNRRAKKPLFDAREALVDQAKIDAVDDWFDYLDNNTQQLLRELRKDRCERVRIAILDTGIDLTHPKFLTKQSKRIRRIKAVEDFLDVDGTGQDVHGHGTHCVGLLRRVAPEADIYVARVIKDGEGILSPEAVTKAINRACREGKDSNGVSNWNVNIISMSCGFYRLIEDVEKAINEAVDRRVLFFAAASNNGNMQQVAFPAYHPRVICVNSSAADGVPSGFNPPFNASRGFSILGENVKSTWIKSEKEEKIMSGTSVATPIAAAVAALILEFALQNDPQDENTDKLLKVLLPWVKRSDGFSDMMSLLMTEKKGDYSYSNIIPWRLLHSELGRKSVAGAIKHAVFIKFGPVF